ncbi:hypothetical protein VTK56DRAFT_1905 [Thermocarpiscus australiensis]
MKQSTANVLSVLSWLMYTEVTAPERIRTPTSPVIGGLHNQRRPSVHHSQASFRPATNFSQRLDLVRLPSQPPSPRAKHRHTLLVLLAVTMCDFEEFIFTCGHAFIRLKNYCHYARNHPQHHCRRVKKLRNCWLQPDECERCQEARRRQQEAYYTSQGPSTNRST